jgi:hypothetical protein
MGREMKRVPMDFDWPLKKTWGGYINPFYSQCIKCPDCEGTGSSKEAMALQKKWYGHVPFHPEERGSKPFLPTDECVMAFAKCNVSHAPEYYGSGDKVVMAEATRLADLFNSQWHHHLNEDDVAALIKATRLMDFTHTWDNKNGWKPKDPPYVPTAKEVNEWSTRGGGHDSINCWVVVNAECDRLGYPHLCKKCNGHGDLWPSPEIKKQSEEWKMINPPTGDGYQLWETTTEGSPVSPVFTTIESLCEWCAENATTFGSATATADEWRGMLEADFVCHKQGNAIFI